MKTLKTNLNYIGFMPIENFKLSEECKKVIEEAAEVRAAYQYDTCEKIIEETLDVMQVCANILNILIPSNESWNTAYHAITIKKNVERGYYHD